MKYLWLCFLIVSLVFFSCKKILIKANNSKWNNTILVAKLDSLILTENQNNCFDGTVLVAQNDKIIFSKAVGKANRVWNIPMQIEHRFDIASLNKSFIAALILKAVEEQKLNLEDKLLQHLPNAEKPFHSDINIHHLLCHTSGLPDYQDVIQIDSNLIKNNFLTFKRLHFDNEGYVNFISRLRANQPNQAFYYSNFAYHLLAIILEKIYQKSFAELLQEKICRPLGLTHTFSETSNQVVHTQIVEAYNFDKKSQAYQRNNFIDLNLGRRIFSSVIDLHKWALAQQKESFLAAKSRQLIQTNHIKPINPEISYGYGWVVYDGNGNYKMGNLGISQKYILHGGATEGYKAMLTIIEDGKWIITHLSNIGNQTNEILLSKKIVQLLNQSENEKK